MPFPARATRLLFAVTTFVAAALVFLVQPRVAKQLLPVVGGTPGVWNASVTFFQVALLVGYAIAHVSLLVLGVRRQPIVQLGLAALAIAFLPFAVGTDSTPPGSFPHALWIGALLAASVGVPYLAVTTASPVLQRWYASIGQPDSAEPWFLYAASNAGSLVGLLAFPVVLEPRLDTSDQELAWVLGFVAYAACIVACALVVRRRTAVDVHEADAHRFARVGVLRAVRWVLIAALPVALMLGVTTFITTDVASAPFLWVLPLALYLLSFIVTFGRRWRVSPRVAGIPAAVSVLLVLLVELERFDANELVRVGVHLAASCFAAVLAHAVLYADRPAAEQLTTFYLLLSVGGAIGGTFVSMLAPTAFNDVYEYPLLLAIVPFLRPASRWVPTSGVVRGLVLVAELALAALVAVALAGAAVGDAEFEARFSSDVWLVVALVVPALLLVRRAGLALLVAVLLTLLTFADQDDARVRDRNFFGTVRVVDEAGMRRMLHGTTLHGGQLLDIERGRVPTTYYTEEGPLGDVFEAYQREEPFVEVGVVGLGTGTTLGHARLWQRFTYYEIDPAVIELARDPEQFTWLSGADVDVRVVEGDARLELEDEERRFDLLVLDAYSSDAVPTHLLTTEAMRLYEQRLTEDGLMVLHISSRHLDLEPVVAANVDRLGLYARTRVDRPSTERAVGERASGSQWIVVVRDPAQLLPLDGMGWHGLATADEDDAWTDDFSNVARTITWLPDWLR